MSMGIVSNVEIRELRDGDVVGGKRVKNVVTSGGLTAIRDFLYAGGDFAGPPIYVAYGSGTIAVGRFDTIVPGETFRTPIVARDKSGLSVIYHWFVKKNDNANQTVGAYALVGGAATLTPNSGTVYAIVNEPTPFSKDATTTYSGDWTLTVSGVY